MQIGVVSGLKKAGRNFHNIKNGGMNKEKRRKIDDKVMRAKQLKKARLAPSMNVMGIDQATETGIAFQMKGMINPTVFIWDLSIGTHETCGLKWLRFESRLREFLQRKKIQALAYEMPAGRNQKPLLHSAKLIAIIEKVCAEDEVEYIELTPSEVKKFATGNGNANKEAMIVAAKELWDYTGDNDNEADAMHILQLLKSKIN